MNSENYFIPIAFSDVLRQSEVYKFTLDEKPVLVVRIKDGLRAYWDRCSHRGSPLNAGQIKDSTIQCPYHGWQFDACTGTNKLVPVKNASVDCSLEKVWIVEKYELIWLSSTADARIPELSANTKTLHFSGTIKASLVNVLENFLEGSHTHYVHNGWVRTSAKKRQKIRATFTPRTTGFEVVYAMEPSKGLLTRLLPRSMRNLRPVAEFQYPNIARLSYFNEAGLCVATFEAILTGTPSATTYFARVYLHPMFPAFILNSVARFFFRKIIAQDKRILELQDQQLKRFPSQQFFSDESDLVGNQLYAWLYKPEKKLREVATFEVYW